LAEAVKGQQRNQPQQIQTPKATAGEAEKQSTEKEREQPVQLGRTTGNKNTSSLDNMIKVATPGQQIITGLK
jgi:hypothetical protein